ncbi:HAD family hydrolase [Roseibium marinum]|uniref:HAD superfamily hydrolase (TIGR01509 family) n=1 Tax=Roseibium marinum TaxID=281252 RepID=A0A2S3UL09_9HYPH|nr:HAD family hydrolase [Roseibium marinum]POF28394.1 HAD superfamily hydrolase (TIGR01509 family) [Roseibium marinum]
MRSGKTVQLVIFDCDGVLIDSEVISARMLVAELANRDVHITMDYVAHHFLGRSYPVVLQQIRKEFGIDLPPEFEIRYRASLLSAFEKDLKPISGVRSVIERLKPDYCLATSSSPPRLAKSLEITGLKDLFTDRTTTASEVMHGKPAPDLFLLAAQKRGIDPADCLVIEDSENGVRAGLAAGMQVWRFIGGSHLKNLVNTEGASGGATKVFASFEEFYRLRPDLRVGSEPLK